MKKSTKRLALSRETLRLVSAATDYYIIIKDPYPPKPIVPPTGDVCSRIDTRATICGQSFCYPTNPC